MVRKELEDTQLSETKVKAPRLGHTGARWVNVTVPEFQESLY